MVKLGKIHILQKNNKTLCGKELSSNTSSGYVYITNKTAIDNYKKE